MRFNSTALFLLINFFCILFMVGQTPKTSNAVEIYNDIGQLIFQEEGIFNAAGVEYSSKELGLSIGIYTIKVYVGDNIRSIKVVKN